MKVLVVGGAGYIGGHVACALLDRGHQVTVFDNLATGLRENVPPGVRIVVGDLLDPASIGAAMSPGIDAVVHLAALKAAGDSMVDPGSYALNNIAGTIHLLNAASEAGIRSLVFSSSAAVYGEPEYVPIDERHPIAPTNFYGYTKVAVEQLLAWYDRLKGLRFASLRYFNAAGYDAAGRVGGLERNPGNLLPLVMETALGLRPRIEILGDDYPTPDGTCIRDYVHVSDLADAHVAAIERLASGAASFTVNLGSGHGFSVKEVLDEARKATGRPIPSVVAPRRPGDPSRVVAASDRAAELIGWKATRSDLATIVATSWNAYRRHVPGGAPSSGAASDAPPASGADHAGNAGGGRRSGSGPAA